MNFNLDNQSMPGVLQKLSMTGGLAQTHKNPGRSTLAEIKLNTIAGPVRGLVELLQSSKKEGAYSLPFRFVAMDEVDQARLKKTVYTMQQKGLGE